MDRIYKEALLLLVLAYLIITNSSVLTSLLNITVTTHTTTIHQTPLQDLHNHNHHLDIMGSKITSGGADAFLALAKTRRTIYQLNKTLPVSTSRIQEIIAQTTLHTPSSFNSQSNRLLVLFGADHDKLWDMTTATLKTIVPEANWQSTADRMAMFKAAAGTVLFFDDMETVQGMQNKFTPYADKFPGWASQSLGMQQYLLWTALELEGLGANLQHYNPLVDQQVAETWGLPKTWQLNAQLVFGGKAGEPGEKDFKPVEERVKVFGA